MSAEGIFIPRPSGDSTKNGSSKLPLPSPQIHSFVNSLAFIFLNTSLPLTVSLVSSTLIQRAESAGKCESRFE